MVLGTFFEQGSSSCEDVRERLSFPTKVICLYILDVRGSYCHPMICKSIPGGYKDPFVNEHSDAPGCSGVTQSTKTSHREVLHY